MNRPSDAERIEAVLKQLAADYHSSSGIFSHREAALIVMQADPLIPHLEAEVKRLREALAQAYEEMEGDYVDSAWGRDLKYIEDLLPAISPHKEGE